MSEIDQTKRHKSQKHEFENATAKKHPKKLKKSIFSHFLTPQIDQKLSKLFKKNKYFFTLKMTINPTRK